MKIASHTVSQFQTQLLQWFAIAGRHDLPWQVTDDPYQVWVSEVMLQQTQVKTVLNYFERFIHRFPTVQALAAAHWDDVAPYWAGLGYYARARNLHRSAMVVAQTGHFPVTLEGWQALAGIGRSTAGALMALGLGQFGVIMDGNVKRVLTRFFAIDGDTSKPDTLNLLWSLATQLTPETQAAAYAQAMMDLGATQCTNKNPQCSSCPLVSDCQAYAQGCPTDFTYKTIRAKIPHKYAHVVVLQDQDQLLWEQRPDAGLWGGLWSLPIREIDSANGVESIATNNIHRPILQTQQGVTGVTIKHTFTHFVWHLTALHYALDSTQFDTSLATPQQRWMTIDAAIAAGIPTAMHKLLTAMNAANKPTSA